MLAKHMKEYIIKHNLLKFEIKSGKVGEVA
jgi:hypothetical protein